MRKRDMHILSAGILMYTSDLRFQVIHPDKSENWTLQIKSPQERDSGVYECQVSTEPKMSLNYSLNVVGIPVLFRLRRVSLEKRRSGCSTPDSDRKIDDADQNFNDSLHHGNPIPFRLYALRTIIERCTES
ncbi:lachesin-like [Frieseomelitta varia]|uniref:lachesin-like n=1 Tax=Frieseomelitta varia TaxID=561572 RepID=UPI001CB6A449|nr:lachesin-like [Frieseomelitta varia]